MRMSRKAFFPVANGHALFIFSFYLYISRINKRLTWSYLICLTKHVKNQFVNTLKKKMGGWCERN